MAKITGAMSIGNRNARMLCGLSTFSSAFFSILFIDMT